jgi:hypothetical protein
MHVEVKMNVSQSRTGRLTKRTIDAMPHPYTGQIFVRDGELRGSGSVLRLARNPSCSKSRFTDECVASRWAGTAR